MLTFDFGFDYSIHLDIVQTWICIFLLLVAVITKYTSMKHGLIFLFRYFLSHFTPIWCAGTLIFFGVLTYRNYENISYSQINFATVVSAALLILLFLPFFRKIGFFGVQAELIALEKNVALETLEKQSATSQTEDQQKIQQKFEELKKEFKEN